MSLARASAAFLHGYRLAVQRPAVGAVDVRELAAALEALDPAAAPFAHEGAAMAWKLREERGAGPGRIERLRTACDPRWHPFLALGVGCALAKLRHELPEGPAVRDGYGFQLGLMERGWHPRGRPTTPEVERGRGRGLWFVAAGNADLCARLIGDAPHEDARWRGVGTACAFAGDPLGHAHRLPDLAGPWRPCIVDGAREAFRMWRSLGPPPRRVLDTLAALDPAPP